MLKARIILEDGSEFEGISFGYPKSVAGEVVFNTAMTGYPESLTDPSYAGQILVMTYPLVGNYGVPDSGLLPSGISLYMESERIHVQALVVHDYSKEFSHWNAKESLQQWLVREKIPAISGVDTRAMTKLLREKGSMKGKVVLQGEDPDTLAFYDPATINQVARVSCQQIMVYGREGGPLTFEVDKAPAALAALPSCGKKRVVLIDCGVKHNIIRCLLDRGVEVIRVPWDFDFKVLTYDGLFISNGPGDPNLCTVTIEHIREALQGNTPICGICMGNQLLGKAAGARVFKLKYGHRGHNQPIKVEGSDICFITTQNHGYALEPTDLSADWEPLYTNLNDGTNEGIRHKTKPFFSSQFHPEACGGPTDMVPVFDQFIASL